MCVTLFSVHPLAAPRVPIVQRFLRTRHGPLRIRHVRGVERQSITTQLAVNTRVLVGIAAQIKGTVAAPFTPFHRGSSLVSTRIFDQVLTRLGAAIEIAPARSFA